MYKSILIGAAMLLLAVVVYLQGTPDFFSAGGPDVQRSNAETTAGSIAPGTSRAVEPAGTLAQSTPEEIRGEEIPILGQKVRLREIRAGGDLVNLEFVIRRGVLPRRLFADGGRRILRFDELYRNNVGYGAATVWLLYQLQSERGVDLAVSRPDGSNFQVLARDLGKVLGFEYLPAENRLRLELLEGGSGIVRDYALPSS